jgi:non-homologous end joining protein Ku
MALKAMWSGVLEINTLFKVHVSICKGSEPYRGKDQLSELCACHHQPFTRQAVCEGGRVRLTEAMEKAGETENATEAVKGVKDGDKYAVLDDAALEAIAAAGTSDGMAASAVVDLERLPAERNSGLYYLRPDEKVKRSKGAVEVLFAALARQRKAIITKWAPRGREMLVAVYPKDGALVMTSLMFESEIRRPDEKCLIATDGVADPEIDAACQVLAMLPGEFDFTSAEDEAVIARQKAIEAARKGEPIPVREPSTDTEAAPDLMAALQAAMQGAPVIKDTRPTTNGAVPVGASS